MDKQVSPVVVTENDRTGLSKETLRRALADNLSYVCGKTPATATLNDFYLMLAYTVRDRLIQRWLNTKEHYVEQNVRVVCYLSAEFLTGPHLANAMLNMDVTENFREAIEESGLDFDQLIAQEEEPGLGNGGLGRLAACYLDSMSTLDIPTLGYGIRYEFGIFDQEIRDGWQVEVGDKWLKNGNPWEIPRPEHTRKVMLGGYTHSTTNAKGDYVVEWVPHALIYGIPYDTPIPGYKTNTANILRLWKAEAPETFNFQAFNQGDYLGSVAEQIECETISKVLYPNDQNERGRYLRLHQQYFFVSCSLQDIISIMLKAGTPIEKLHEKIAIQLNDTHPSIAVPELMRLLMDEHNLEWDDAWHVTVNTFAYTNHTLLPESLERWPISILATALPRHMEIINEINRRFLEEVAEKVPGDPDILRRVSIVDEDGDQTVRMAYLACAGSHYVNGVAALHSELIKTSILKDIYRIWPEKFGNVTNGVTPRRWLQTSNTELTQLLNELTGTEWQKDMDKLQKLKQFADDKEVHHRWQQGKLLQKKHLAALIHKQLDIAIDPLSMFDVQVKRIHEYKRQHLNVLHIITLFNRIKSGKYKPKAARTCMFGGKAAPGYLLAKLIIKLITSVAEVVNNDPEVNELLKVVFLPNFNVTLGQQVYPAADLSEQISTAGLEASGTGNMKFAMNGALTIGTMDGANIEIREAVGPENFFLFGLTESEIRELRASGYEPWSSYQSNEELQEVVEQLRGGYFSRGDKGLFEPLLGRILQPDNFMVLADYEAYINCQTKVSEEFCNHAAWTKKSIMNVASMGPFSSDRSIREYCDKIWHVKPVPIELPDYCPDAAALKVDASRLKEFAATKD